MDTSPVCIAVLAHGQSDAVLDGNTVMRINRALELAQAYQWARVPVRIVFMAGTGKQESEETMASTMWTYAQSVMKVRGVQIPIFANHKRKEVWGTIQEMSWIQRMVKDIPDCRLVFVTNERHGKRVLHTNDLIHQIPRCSVEASSDEPPPWWHEALAYLKLGVCLLGFGAPAEAFRRKYYTR
jgi:hypothetical protein